MRGLWRSFRGLPAWAQAGTVLVVLAAYTAVIVALVSGGGGSGGSEAARPPARGHLRAPATALERQIASYYATAKEIVRPKDSDDIKTFRRLRLTGIRCQGTTCDAAATTALPGAGRIAEDLSPILVRLYGETPVRRFRVTVSRRSKTSGTKPSEETPIGLILLRADCDRERDPTIDPRTADPTLLLTSYCTISTTSPGRGGGANPGRGDNGPGVIG